MRAASEPGPSFDPFDPATHADPYPVYARLRSSANGIHGGRGFVVVSRFADVLAVLRDRRFGQVLPRAAAADPAAQVSLLDLDPPAHTELRRVATRLVQRARVGRLRPRIEAAAAALVQPLRDGAEVELMGEVAAPLAWTALSELLGIALPDRAEVLTRVRLVTDALEHPEAASDAVVASASDYLSAYLAGLSPRVLDLPAHPQRRSTVAQSVGLLRLLLVAGQDTTASMIGNSVLALLSDPAAALAWRDGRFVNDAAVDELIRFDGPVQFVARRVLVDTELHGCDLVAGTTVLALLGSANRDPAEFDEPDRLRLDRHNSGRQLGFAHGPHFCLGADLARLTVGCALDALFGRCPAFDLTGPALRSPRVTLRGLSALPVERRASDR